MNKPLRCWFGLHRRIVVRTSVGRRRRKFGGSGGPPLPHPGAAVVRFRHRDCPWHVWYQHVRVPRSAGWVVQHRRFGRRLSDT